MNNIVRNGVGTPRKKPLTAVGHQRRSRALIVVALLLSLFSMTVPSRSRASYIVNNLVSDLSGVAAVTDPNLVNPWGLASSPTSPIWVSDNGTGVSTLYNGAGQPLPLVVAIPPPSGGSPPAAPTGVVSNPTSDFGGAHFIFATEDGTIAAWTSGTSAIRQVDNSASGAVYKGLAVGNNGTANLLYATNFNAGRIDVFNSSFAPVTLSGSFTDPNLPAGYAPFVSRTSAASSTFPMRSKMQPSTMMLRVWAMDSSMSSIQMATLRSGSRQWARSIHHGDWHWRRADLASSAMTY